MTATRKPKGAKAIVRAAKAPTKRRPSADAVPAGKAPKQRKHARQPAHSISAAEDRFCQEYLIDCNGTRAYMRANAGVSEKTARTMAARQLAKVGVSQRITALRAEQAQRLSISADRVLQEVWSIAMADPREIVSYIRSCCRNCYGAEHQYQRTSVEMEEEREAHELQEDEKEERALARNRTHVRKTFQEKGGLGYDGRREPHPDCPACLGLGVERVVIQDTRKLSPQAVALFAGIKQTKDGVEVKLNDKRGAAEMIFRHLGLYEEDNSQQADREVVTAAQLDELYERAQARAQEQRKLMEERRTRLAAEEAERIGQSGHQ